MYARTPYWLLVSVFAIGCAGTDESGFLTGFPSDCAFAFGDSGCGESNEVNGNNGVGKDEKKQSHFVRGQHKTFGTGTVTAWAEVMRSGAVDKVGVTLSADALESMTEETNVIVRLPGLVRSTTYIDHVAIGFNPEGHPPAPYMIPHFDVHFYGLTINAVAAIDCVDELMPDAAALPSPYIIPGTGPEPGGTCVPKMGVHAIDPTSPELTGSPFTETLILGYHKGLPAFIEPMVAQTYFASHAGYARPVPLPMLIGRDTRWPTSLVVSYDADTDNYTIYLDQFVSAD